MHRFGATMAAASRPRRKKTGHQRGGEPPKTAGLVRVDRRRGNVPGLAPILPGRNRTVSPYHIRANSPSKGSPIAVRPEIPPADDGPDVLPYRPQPIPVATF